MSGLTTLLCPDAGLDGRRTASVDIEEAGLWAGEERGDGVKVIVLLTPVLLGVPRNRGAGIRNWRTELAAGRTNWRLPPGAGLGTRTTNGAKHCCWVS